MPDHFLINLLKFYFLPFGRISRTEFWIKYFFPLLIKYALPFLAFHFITKILERSFFHFSPPLWMIIMAITTFVWISFCVWTKRLHDLDRSAWWVLLIFIPVIGWIWLMIQIGFLHGHRGKNKYGYDPTTLRTQTLNQQ